MIKSTCIAGLAGWPILGRQYNDKEYVQCWVGRLAYYFGDDSIIIRSACIAGLAGWPIWGRQYNHKEHVHCWVSQLPILGRPNNYKECCASLGWPVGLGWDDSIIIRSACIAGLAGWPRLGRQYDYKERVHCWVGWLAYFGTTV